ncbi:hypothetical protein AVDCRST_MAG92-4742 [uncultured Coleofasciculus sp.]|jgi:hypothetical protein|uniref:Uncharacterized protein n=1 Tax=uncultured Coleofasciculus sp. TaxID=1267456 RepID=A0A6J4K5E5_9CYAN|nr:hypothetical protein AVDCRST_MAG92-4742 [uncultured Coleofasciculus sp.]
MKTLLELFTKERNSLEREIEKANSPEQVVKLVQNKLDSLERNYIGELSVSQIRLVSFFMETLRQSLATLTAASEKRVSQPDGKNINSNTAPAPKSLILKGIQGLIGLGIFGELFSLTPIAPGAWMAILLTSVLVGVEVTLQLDKGKSENSLDEQRREAPKPMIQVDSKVFLDNLADALNTIDLAVASASPVKKSLDATGIEELPELLNLLQRQMGASFLGKPQMALELTKLLPQILMEQGIRVQMYRPNEQPSYREYFDFEPSIDPSTKDYVTITPALLKGDRLLRRGRVIEPTYSEELNIK